MDWFNMNSQTFVDLEHYDQVDPFFAATRKVYDPIHSFMVFDQYTWNFIDTPEFQRLRDVRQLGGVAFVFQGATHTRFEHCLGTGYLAQKQVNHIFKHQSDVVASLDSKSNANRIKSNITLAGLLHDLGHALFSHLFDLRVIDKLCPGSDWCHEKGSAMLIDYLIEKNNIDIEKEDSTMVKDLILGNNTDPLYQEMTWIFDIVANKRNSIDVDKYDYMIRDSYHLGLKDTSFDYRFLMKESRVINDEICFPAKMCHKVYELFQARYKLYKGIYHNRASEAIELMIEEVLLEANSYYKFDQAISNPEEYVKLTDHLILDIEHSKTPELEKARKIIERLRKRDTYKFVSETIIDSKAQIHDEQRIKADVLSCAVDDGTENVLRMQDFEIRSGTNNFAFKDKNPVDCVKFYNKSNIKTLITALESFFIDKEQVSLLLPSRFSEKFLRIYVKDSSKSDRAKEAFQKYCKNTFNVSTTPIESKTFIGTPSKKSTVTEDSNPFEPLLKKKLFTQKDEDRQQRSPLSRLIH